MPAGKAGRKDDLNVDHDEFSGEAISARLLDAVQEMLQNPTVNIEDGLTKGLFAVLASAGREIKLAHHRIDLLESRLRELSAPQE